MHTILVPLDGSTTAERALRIAYAVAERIGAEVVAMRVRTHSDDDAHEPHGDDGDTGESYLRAAVRRFTDSAPTRLLVVDGDPASQILAAASPPDTMVCMASHGRTGLTRLVLGSVAEEVVRHAAAPVIVVGPHGTSVPLRSERAHLVVCTDGSPAAETVVTPAASLSNLLGTTCDVIHATPPDEDVSLDLLPAPVPIRDRAEGACRRCCELLRDADVDASAHLLFGEPAGAVTGHARRTHASFIAVATHGRSGFARATLGSTAADIVRLSPCPVLVVPAGAT